MKSGREYFDEELFGAKNYPWRSIFQAKNVPSEKCSERKMFLRRIFRPTEKNPKA
jgi:hypothetical protein